MSVQNCTDPELRKADMQKKWSGAAHQRRAHCTTGAEKTAPGLSVQRQQPAGSDHEHAGKTPCARGLAGPELPPGPSSTSRPSLSEHGVRPHPARLPGKEEKEGAPLERKEMP